MIITRSPQDNNELLASVSPIRTKTSNQKSESSLVSQKSTVKETQDVRFLTGHDDFVRERANHNSVKSHHHDHFSFNPQIAENNFKPLIAFQGQKVEKEDNNDEVLLVDPERHVDKIINIATQSLQVCTNQIYSNLDLIIQLKYLSLSLE